MQTLYQLPLSLTYLLWSNDTMNVSVESCEISEHIVLTCLWTFSLTKRNGHISHDGTRGAHSSDINQTEPRQPIADLSQVPVTVVQRVDVSAITRRKYENLVAKIHVTKATDSPTPSECFLILHPGDKVLAIRENKGWMGPYMFNYNAGKLALVVDAANKKRPFLVTQIKPCPTLPTLEDLSTEAHAFII